MQLTIFKWGATWIPLLYVYSIKAQKYQKFIFKRLNSLVPNEAYHKRPEKRKAIGPNN